MEHAHTLWLDILHKLHHKLTGVHPPHHDDHKKDSQRIDKDIWRNLEENFGLVAADKPDLSDEPVCERPWFECFIGVMVMINAITMALELDFTHKDDSAKETLGWTCLDVAFCAFFTGEVIFRVRCLGFFDFLRQPRYLADLLLVMFNIADSGAQLSGSESTGLQSFSALRILRLFKIMKLLRLVSHVKELSLIATGLVSALKSLQWVSLLLGVVIFVMAVMFKLLMGRDCDAEDVKEAYAYRFPDIDPIVKCEEFWGSVFRSMYTFYQIVTLESWSEVLVRPIFDSRPWMVAIILLFQLVTTFGLLNIVVAAIVDGTMNSIDAAVVENQNKKHITAHLSVLRDVWLEATRATDGCLPSDKVTPEMLLPCLTKSENRSKLLLLNIEFDDPSQIWRIVDTDGSGSVDIKEFVTNLMRMRGSAKAKDLLAVRSQIYRECKKLSDKVDGLRTTCDSMSSASPSQAGLPSSKGEELAGAASYSTALERFQVELRDELGKLSGAFQDQLGIFREQLSKDVQARLGMFESDLFQEMTATRQNVQVSPIPYEQGLPSIPSQSCCSLAVGANDRQAIPPQPVRLAPILDSGGPDTKLASLLTVEHRTLIDNIEEKHKGLLRRLSGTAFAKADIDAIVTKLAQEPATAKATEPKALGNRSDPLVAQRNSSSSASTQTEIAFAQENLGDEALAGIPSPCLGDRLLASPARAQAEVNPLTTQDVAESQDRRGIVPAEDLTKKKVESGGFALALEEHKKEQASKVSRAEAFVHGPIFEGVMGFLITANAGIMALEVQYSGIDVGYNLKYPNANETAAVAWPGAKGVFKFLELAFGLVFVAELLIKMIVLRLNFIWSSWNILDSVIVGSWVADSLFGVSAVLNPMMLRLFRLVKLLRVAKLFKSFQAFDSLGILIGSMKASASVLFWSTMVLFTVQLASALFMAQALQTYLEETGKVGKDAVAQQEVYEYFGSFTRAFVTTTQLTLGNWVPVCRLLTENLSEIWAIFIIGYVIMIPFACIRVISAVFIVETQKVASSDEELLILQKERQIARLIKNFSGVFKDIDRSGDGQVDWEEFQNVIHDHRVLTWLAALDLDIEQCEGMFSLLDGGDGKVSFDEFVKGVQHLKGAAKSIDLIMLMNRQAELTNHVIQLKRTVEEDILHRSR